MSSRRKRKNCSTGYNLQKRTAVKVKRIILAAVMMAAFFATSALAEEYTKTEIKQGMYEDIVNERFGMPELTQDLEPGFFPIPRKRALYRLGDSDFMILSFYSKRVNKITILSDMDREEAERLFEAEGQRD
jgi:hypothetical protein